MAEEGPMAQISLAAAGGGGEEEVRSTRTQAGRLLSRAMSPADARARTRARQFTAAPGPGVELPLACS